jgi:anti-sigma regulatory factor (Ser/Thr protein kinase)
MGGLGIFLARKLMDGFLYRREDDQNVLVMYKNAEARKS